MQLMIVIDISIVTVALHSIQRDLGFEQAHLAWVTNAYTVGFGGSLLLSGRLGDLVGRKRMFVAGLSVFTLFSALGGVSQNQGMLIAMRFFQGVGAAMAYAVVMGIIFTLFQDPREVGKAMGAAGFVQAAGAAIGILLGAFLTQGINWHWVFFINVPIGVAAGVLAVKVVPADKGMGFGSGIDIAGAVLATAGMMLGVYTIATVGDYGWQSGHTFGFGLGALALLVGFVLRQTKAPVPLMPLTLFRSRNLTGGNLAHMLLVAATISFNILVALYLQQVVGYSPIKAGLAFLPLALCAAVASLTLSHRLNAKFGLRTVLLASLVVMAAGLLLAARLPVHPDYAVDLLPVVVLLGAGGGLAMPAVMMLSMSVTSPQDAGLASGLAGTSGTVGDSIGIATMTAIAASHATTLLARGQSLPEAMTGGYRLSFGIGAGVLAVAFVLGLLILRTPQQPMGGPPPSDPAAELAGAESIPI
ncbi:MFS transporter [Kitasatospora mediocidica]|uniref:MFS transporter n=1 Tax=Kitasatospora mediocidica TaxID=58352 RepID=UPI0007C7DD95|nr:MFS transporter [Kitasatospora mediocidica]